MPNAGDSWQGHTYDTGSGRMLLHRGSNLDSNEGR